MDNSLDLYAMMSALQSDSEDESTLNQRTPEEVVELGAKLVSELLQIEKEEQREAPNDLLPFIQQEHFSEQRFRETFIVPRKPVVITNGTQGWLANSEWELQSLVSRLGKESFSLFNGQEFPLSDYVQYMNGRGEDDPEPFYLFEDLSKLTSGDPKSSLLSDYEVLPYFQRDVYSGIDLSRVSAEDLETSKKLDQGVRLEETRPRFRWLLIGPARSGTKLHVDPLFTSAWNALLSGHKRWVLISPQVPSERIDEITEQAIDCASLNLSTTIPNPCSVVDWFQYVLPRLRKELPEHLVEFTQHPGEVVFVPTGWWHIVINLDVTVAITENFASPSDFPDICKTLRLRAPVFFRNLCKDLVVKKPEQVAQLTMEYQHDNQRYWLPPFGESIRNMRKGGASQLRMGVWSPSDREWLLTMQKSYNRFRIRTALDCSTYGVFSECEPAGVSSSTEEVKHSPTCNGEKGAGASDPAVDTIQGGEDTLYVNIKEQGGIIPHIIHHIWLGGEVPQYFQQLRQGWMEQHKTWTFKLWTDESLLTSGFELRHREEFDRATDFGQKSDILRYEVLYQFGGVYVDSDFVCTRSLAGLADNCDFFIGQSNTSCIELNNGIIGAVPKSPVVGKLLDDLKLPGQELSAADVIAQSHVKHFLKDETQALQSHIDYKRNMDTIASTGPGYVSRTVMDVLSVHSVQTVNAVVFPPTFFYPLPNNQLDVDVEESKSYAKEETLAIHLWRGSWKVNKT